MPQIVIENRNLESEVLADAALQPWARLRGPRMDHFPERPFPRLFEDEASRAPEKPAVIYENETLTFAELNTRANQLARYLQSLGAGAESLIGICVERSLDMGVGILGILKSGAAYLPLDPDYPRERLAFMLDDARPSLVLTKSKLAGLVSGAAHAVLLDGDWARISEQSETNLVEAPRPDDLAYVIYTSGSTGKPKGVMITHGNLANYLLALDHELQIRRDDLYLHAASIAFSSSRRQLMLPLSQGATVVIASSEQRKDPLALFAMIKQRGVTVMDAVPSFWRNCTSVLASLDPDTRARLLNNKLRLMLSASEPLQSDIPRTWATEFRHPARHVHMFGQTETAGIVALYCVPSDIDAARVVPVGHAIANSEILILDEQQRLCPIGVAGELYIGGAGVGRGYLNRPELTTEKFVEHPFADQPGTRLYRTGDFARLNAEGQIEYAGRRDQQVKLRGFRVELGEVEAALTSHPAIHEAVVTARELSDGEARLVGYIVLDGAPPNARELREFLSVRLPEYEIPSVFVMMNALPLSANGKVDRRALPDPENERPELATEYIAPGNNLEKRLTEIWTEVLKIDRIGVQDNFFELGGNSLLATQVAARVRHKLKIEMPIRLLFENSTIVMLAKVIETLGLTDRMAITRSDRNETAPLSFTQQQFWLLDQAEAGKSHYNVRTAIKIEGLLDTAKLQHAFEAIIARHEILRTTFVVKDGSPMQVIAPSLPFTLNVSDLSALSVPARDKEIERAQADEAEKQFDLARGPLFRIELLKLKRDEHALMITLHHIICDGWSISLLLRELVSLYQSEELDNLPIQYADFSVWQREHFETETMKRQMDYWKQKLANAPLLELPTDHQRPATRSFNGAQESLLLPGDLSNAIKELSRREGVTLFITLLAAFQALLFHYSGQDDIAVGSPIAGRTLIETENLIGAFVNTLVFRGDLSGNPTFCEFLGRIRETALGAYAHQEAPFEKIVEELRPERTPNRTPLFDVMFVLETTAADVESGEIALRPLKVRTTKAKFDLTLKIEDEPVGLRASFEYNTDLLARATMQRMLAHFQNLLTAVVAHPLQRLAQLPLLGDDERRQMLVDWNATAADFSRDACIHEVFEARVCKAPDAIAAEFQGKRLTYRELNARANQLARYLRKEGVEREVLVGVCVERSLEMLVSILAVLKAGGAYVPLDPTYPRERIAFMIEDAGLTILLTQERLVKDISAGEARLICVDDAEIFSQEREQNLTIDVTPDNLAYVIYTSGSTGKPKGVEVEHRSVVNFVEAAVASYPIKSSDRVLQFTSLCFDISVEEIYPALIAGATLVLRTDAMISSPRDFLNQCEAWRLTVLDFPTAYWHELVDAIERDGLKLPTSVHLTIIGGESASADRVRVWKKLIGESVRLLNAYGPTETTVTSITCDLGQHSDVSSANVSIGRPIANTTIFVLDEMRQPVPIGVPGELYIGGAGLARGYLNRPELTAEKFISNAFSSNPITRLYRTGDLVRYRADGNIECVGRIDNQIKIRGFRVELGEIEQALRNHPFVADGVVVLQEDNSGNKRLVAYVVALKDSQLDPTQLRNFLKTSLPSYMVPAVFEWIEVLPMTPNGKIDRRALPEPGPFRPETGESFVAPGTLMETLLASAWCDALKLERVGINDNFFELGGHSLLAARIVSNLRSATQIELTMVDVLRSPTIAELGALLEERDARDETEGNLALLLAELAELSDEETQQRLAAELAQNATEAVVLSQV
jgi:amino acid adenylation domain-containing protein